MNFRTINILTIIGQGFFGHCYLFNYLISGEAKSRKKRLFVKQVIFRCLNFQHFRPISKKDLMNQDENDGLIYENWLTEEEIIEMNELNRFLVIRTPYVGFCSFNKTR